MQVGSLSPGSSWTGLELPERAWSRLNEPGAAWTSLEQLAWILEQQIWSSSLEHVGAALVAIFYF